MRLSRINTCDSDINAVKFSETKVRKIFKAQAEHPLVLAAVFGNKKEKAAARRELRAMGVKLT